MLQVTSYRRYTLPCVSMWRDICQYISLKPFFLLEEHQDPYRPLDEFNINDPMDFAKDYYQFSVEELEGTDYLHLRAPRRKIEKAIRIQEMLLTVDSTLKELDYLIDIEALENLYLDENSIVENHGECEGETCADEFLFNEQKRALKKLIYENITTPFEVTILSWVLMQRMDAAIWENLDIDGLSSIENPDKRKWAFIKSSQEVWEYVKKDFLNNKTYKTYQLYAFVLFYIFRE